MLPYADTDRTPDTVTDGADYRGATMPALSTLPRRAVSRQTMITAITDAVNSGHPAASILGRLDLSRVYLRAAACECRTLVAVGHILPVTHIVATMPQAPRPKVVMFTNH